MEKGDFIVFFLKLPIIIRSLIERERLELFTTRRFHHQSRDDPRPRHRGCRHRRHRSPQCQAGHRCRHRDHLDREKVDHFPK